MPGQCGPWLVAQNSERHVQVICLAQACCKQSAEQIMALSRAQV